VVTPGRLGSASLTSLLDGPDGPIEYLTTGNGEPRTVFAHGLAGSIDTTRPFGSGVRGSRTFFHFRGHGASAAPETPWTYAALAGELRVVADHVGATRALGVSMGAGALCHWLEREPKRFERVVFALPAVLDTPRSDAAMERLVAMAQAADDRDVEGMADLLAEEQPAGLRDTRAVRHWCDQQAHRLVGTPVSRALRSLPHEVAMDDREALSGIPVPVLVLAQEGDPAHPVHIAEEIAGRVPHARLEMLPEGGIMWRHRARVRELVGRFLCGDPDD
jgi:pimeloyl-ACP methyl ester carboxylesterase